MRELLEYLGLVDPPTGRREPVALPAWARWTFPVVIAALTVVSLLILTAVRIVLS